MKDSSKTKAQLLAELGALRQQVTDCEAREAQRAAELAVINSVQQGLASKLDLQAIYDLVGDKIRDIFDAQVVNILTYDPATNMACFCYMIERGTRMTAPPRPVGDRGFTPLVIRTRQPLLINRGMQQRAAEVGSTVVAGEMPRSALYVPLIVGDQVKGVISLQNLDHEDAFSEGDLRLLTTLANSMSVALENARLFDETQRLLQETEQRAAELAIINSVGEAMAKNLDVQTVTHIVGDKVRDIFKAEVTAILLLDPATQMIHPVYSYDRGYVQDEMLFPLGQGLTSIIIQSRKPLVLGTYQAAAALGAIFVPDASGDEVQPESYLGVPIIVGAKVLGVVDVQSYRPNAFDEDSVRLLSTLSANMGVAIENARLFQEANRLLKESEQRAAELATVNGISQALASELELSALIHLVGERVRETFAADIAYVALLDQPNNRIEFPYSYGEVITPLQYGEGLTSKIIETGQPLLINQDMETRRAELGATLVGVAAQSYLGVPILVGRQAIGVISVQSTRQAGRFTDADVHLLSTITANVGVAIENARLYTEIRRRAREAAAIAEVGREISATLDLPVVLERIAAHARDLLAADTSAVYLSDPDGQAFRAIVALGPIAEAIKADTVHLGEGIMGDLARRGGAEFVNDALHDPRARHIPGTSEIAADERLMVAPLLAGERVTGMMAVWRTAGERFAQADLDFLVGLARQAAIAIENARLLEAAQESQRRMADIIDFLPDATLVVDREGKVIAWNRAIEEMTGVKAADMLGKGNYEYALPFYGERRPILIDLVLRPQEEIEKKYTHIQQHGATLMGEAVVPLLQGQPAYLYATASALRNSKGEIVGAIETIRDISDRKRAEQALREAQAEAEAARRQAEAANEAKSAFLATMSHEIRTPMNGIIGMTGLLLDTALNSDQREFAETIRSSGETLLTIINDILDFSKIESRKMELESQPFNLRDCLESALDLVATTAAEKKLDLAYVVEDGVPAAIVGDVTRVRQILLNLLSNAVKFTEQGEVVVTVAGTPTPTPIPPHSHTTYGGVGVWELHFSVRDTGIGIPPDRLDRLFRAFTQVDASTSRKYGGTGLGLAISKRLSEMMGGRLWAESTGLPGPLGGSTFHFTLVAEAAPELKPRAGLSGEQPQLRGRRMLIVDDNATNRRILTLQAQSWGMLARDTASPAEALGWIRQGDPFDVAILDMHMPEMDGVALATAIRRHRDACALPLILFSSLGRREAGEEQGTFAAYLTKPLKQSQLFDALARLFVEESPPSPDAALARPRVDPEMATHLPLRILLAEDNTVNQKVALRFLAQMGYRADVAANGLEALQAVERQRYDVVLMDVQMPEMDGLEATRRLYARWPHPERPRIIAMTANAMQGDREMCLEAGMDDYLAKPIRIEELASALGRTQPRVEIGAKRERPEEVLDPATLDNLAAASDAGFVQELINAFLEDSPQLLAELRRALAEGKADVFRRAAHSLKSNGASLGAMRLSAMAKELELKGKAGDLAGADAKVEQLAAEYERAESALRAWRYET